MIKEIMSFFGYTEKENTKQPKTSATPEMDMVPVEYKSWVGYIQDYLQRQIDDNKKYKEYDLMDNETAEISTSLDILTDYIVYGTDSTNPTPFKIKLKNSKYQSKLDEILDRIEFYNNIPSVIRSALKYGDSWEEIILNKSNSKVMKTRHIPIASVLPVVKNGILQENPMIKQINITTGKVITTLSADKIFRINLYKDRKRMVTSGKGTSAVEKSRLIYRQIRLMEEGIMITRLSRCNQNYAMMVDVGELQGDDALEFLDKYKKRLMRRKYIDKSTGKWKWEYNPLSVSEDILLPTRQGSGSGITVLNSASDVGKSISDIEYFQNKLIYSTGVPKILIGKENDINSKSTSDVQLAVFYRTVRRYQTTISPFIIEFIQQCLKTEKIMVDKKDITIEWGILDSVDEKRKWEIEKLKLEIAGTMASDLGLVDDLYIYTELLGWTEEEAKEMMNRLDNEEEAYAEEVDDMLDDAEDLSGQETDEFDTADDTMSKNKEKNKEKPEEETKPTEEELQNYIKNKLGEEKYKKWLKVQKIIEETPELQETLANIIVLTQAKLGE